MSKPTEFDLVSRVPFVHRRRITWSDTDAARIVYTVRFFEFAMAGIEAWFREVWGRDWFRLHTDLDMGSPFVRVETDLLGPLVPGDILDVRVLVAKCGRSSLTFAVDGMKAEDGARVFSGRYTCAIVRMNPMRAVGIPPEQRAVVEDYMAACEALGEG